MYRTIFLGRRLTRPLVLIALAAGTMALPATVAATPPAIDINPKMIRFGTQTVGTTSSVLVTLTNQSSDTIFIDGMSLGVKTGTNPFDWDLSRLDLDTCDPMFWRIPPGGSCSPGAMIFRPTEADHYRGFLYVEFEVFGANGPHDSVTATVTGRAVSP